MPDSGLTCANGLFQMQPRGIANAVPEAQERAQVGGCAPTQIGGSNRTVLIAISLSIYEAQGDHGIDQDAYGSTRDASTFRQFVEGNRSVSQLFKQPYLVGDVEVFGCLLVCASRCSFVASSVTAVLCY